MIGVHDSLSQPLTISFRNASYAHAAFSGRALPFQTSDIEQRSWAWVLRRLGRREARRSRMLKISPVMLALPACAQKESGPTFYRQCVEDSVGLAFILR